MLLLNNLTYRFTVSFTWWTRVTYPVCQRTNLLLENCSITSIYRESHCCCEDFWIWKIHINALVFHAKTKFDFIAQQHYLLIHFWLDKRLAWTFKSNFYFLLYEIINWFCILMFRLANKQDLPGAVDEIDLVESLDIERVANMVRCPTRVETCSCLEPITKSNKANSGILNGYR